MLSLYLLHQQSALLKLRLLIYASSSLVKTIFSHASGFLFCIVEEHIGSVLLTQTR